MYRFQYAIVLLPIINNSSGFVHQGAYWSFSTLLVNVLDGLKLDNR